MEIFSAITKKGTCVKRGTPQSTAKVTNMRGHLSSLSLSELYSRN